MTLNLSRLVAGMALCLIAACGAPGAHDLCIESCEAYRRCGYANGVDTTNCKTDCDDKKGAFSDSDTQLAKNCKNSGDIRKMQAACYDNTSCRGNVLEYTLALGSCIADPEQNSCIRP